MIAIITLILILVAHTSYAGGTSNEGEIKEFHSNKKITSFKFIQTDGEPNLIKLCSEFTVILEYKRVPWFSWFPYVETSHPTEKQSKKAINFIKTANKNNKKIQFGFMGAGFKETKEKCIFRSRGLLLMNDNEESEFVASFYNQV